MNITRVSIEEREKHLLAPYAAHSADSLGREYQEPEHDMRTAFQRDRDRIIHTQAFRRLEYKTQVFVNHEGDHYRTRLTHTIEVSQIARSIARALGLNEELAEAVALAHDLGHPPFGHAGEKVLDELMKDHGGFEHNIQALRIVEVLEKRYPSFPGLNLTWETREGIIKYLHRYQGPMPPGLTNTVSPSFEAQVVDVADEIAYNNHDLDDGLSSRLFDLEEVQDTLLWREHYKSSKKSFPGSSWRESKHDTIRRIINSQVQDIITSTCERIKTRKIRDITDVRVNGHDLVVFSEDMNEKNIELKRFLMTRMYKNERVMKLEKSARKTLSGLFQLYIVDPNKIPEHVRKLEKVEGRYRMVCDYVAGMTDRYALQQYERWLGS
ncbi:MAG: deoxyguanosinetriphosphate triphosphohydrolase [Nitrospinae bacterium]|nr:deoxyguanosinetriphosphate triphosphohydrolase [Nitrospinota bacterium]